MTIINGTDLQTFTCFSVPTALALIVRPARGPPAGRKKATMFSQLINTILLTIMLKTYKMHVNFAFDKDNYLPGHITRTLKYNAGEFI